MNLVDLKAESFLKQLYPLIDLSVHFGIKLLIACCMAFVGFWLSKKATQAFKKVMTARKVEVSLLVFLTSLINITSKILVVVVVLATVGIEMTSIITILGAASLAIGMALSGTLSNFAGGVVLLILKPFKVGDLIEIENGEMGYVVHILIFTTEIRTFENQIVYLPNGHLANQNLKNHSRMGARRAQVNVGLTYGNDVEVARHVILEMLENDERVHKIPAPMVVLSDLADSAVVISVRFWTGIDNLYPMQFEYRERIYKEMPKHGLTFPFPQMDVHIKQSLKM